jgi:hypothetical protein
LAPRPSPSPVSKLDRLHTGRLRKRDNLLDGIGRGMGWARSRIIRPQVAWSSINHSVLSGDIKQQRAFSFAGLQIFASAGKHSGIMQKKSSRDIVYILSCAKRFPHMNLLFSKSSSDSLSALSLLPELQYRNALSLLLKPTSKPALPSLLRSLLHQTASPVYVLACSHSLLPNLFPQSAFFSPVCF